MCHVACHRKRENVICRCVSAYGPAIYSEGMSDTDCCCGCQSSVYNRRAEAAMNDRVFRKLKAGTARAALVMCSWLGLALAVVGPVGAQGTGGTNGQSGRVVTA